MTLTGVKTLCINYLERHRQSNLSVVEKLTNNIKQSESIDNIIGILTRNRISPNNPMSKTLLKLITLLTSEKVILFAKGCVFKNGIKEFCISKNIQYKDLKNTNTTWLRDELFETDEKIYLRSLKSYKDDYQNPYLDNMKNNLGYNNGIENLFVNESDIKIFFTKHIQMNVGGKLHQEENWKEEIFFTYKTIKV